MFDWLTGRSKKENRERSSDSAAPPTRYESKIVVPGEPKAEVLYDPRASIEEHNREQAERPAGKPLDPADFQSKYDPANSIRQADHVRVNPAHPDPNAVWVDERYVAATRGGEVLSPAEVQQRSEQAKAASEPVPVDTGLLAKLARSIGFSDARNTGAKTPTNPYRIRDHQINPGALTGDPSAAAGEVFDRAMNPYKPDRGNRGR